MNKQGTDMIKAVRLWEKIYGGHGIYGTQFHLMPPSGWLNDPNGLGKLGDTLHIYFQYSPFGTKPGLNFWGHYKTQNYISYQYCRPALCCDTPYDCHGVYSGSAYIENKKAYLYYTGNVLHNGDYDYIYHGREHNTMLAVTDGNVVEEKSLLMRNVDYPKDTSCHVRDPKVFFHDGKYYMVLGARRRDDTGEILLYCSEDKLNWKFLRELTMNERFGYMWECPDLFMLDGQWVLMFSPQGVEPQGYQYQNTYQTGYVFLEGGLESDCPLGEFMEIDRGFDFYAPQSYLETDGRRIQIGWMAVPDSSYAYAEEEAGWKHILTVPCVLKRRGRKIYRYPVRELKQLREQRQEVRLLEHMVVQNLTQFDMEITVEEGEAFTIVCKQDGKMTFQKGVFTLSFGVSGRGRTSRSVVIKKIEKIRILCDTSSLEIFLNEGEESFSSRFYPEKICGNIEFEGLIGRAEFWTMKSFVISGEKE